MGRSYQSRRGFFGGQQSGELIGGLPKAYGDSREDKSSQFPSPLSKIQSSGSSICPDLSKTAEICFPKRVVDMWCGCWAWKEKSICIQHRKINPKRQLHSSTQEQSTAKVFALEWSPSSVWELWNPEPVACLPCSTKGSPSQRESLSSHGPLLCLLFSGMVFWVKRWMTEMWKVKQKTGRNTGNEWT